MVSRGPNSLEKVDSSKALAAGLRFRSSSDTAETRCVGRERRTRSWGRALNPDAEKALINAWERSR